MVCGSLFTAYPLSLMFARLAIASLVVSSTLALPASFLSMPLLHGSSTCKIAGLEGTTTHAGACRYTVKYAEVSERWGYSSVVSAFSYVIDSPDDKSKLIGRNSSASELPPACPQSANTLLKGQTSEDCLYAVVCTPQSTSSGDKLPVFVW